MFILVANKFDLNLQCLLGCIRPRRPHGVARVTSCTKTSVSNSSTLVSKPCSLRRYTIITSAVFLCKQVWILAILSKSPLNTIALKWITIFTARRYAKHGICRRRVSVCPSVCVCVSVTVTRLYCIKTAKRRITQITPYDSPGALVF